MPQSQQRDVSVGNETGERADLHTTQVEDSEGDFSRSLHCLATAVFDSEDLVERLMGDQQLAQRIVHGFVGGMPRQIALLSEAVTGLDFKMVRSVAHSIKGAAANVGGRELREVAGKLEQTGLSGDLTAATAALPELAASFERARLHMEAFSRGELTYAVTRR